MVYSCRLRFVSLRECLEGPFVKPISVAEVPCAQNDSRHAIVAMEMRRDRRVQGRRKERWCKYQLRWISKQNFRADPARSELPIFSEPVWFARTSPGVFLHLRQCQRSGTDSNPNRKKGVPMVSCGRSSISQCPVLGDVMDTALADHNFTCLPRASPFGFNPANQKTGIVSFISGNCAKSFAAS